MLLYGLCEGCSDSCIAGARVDGVVKDCGTLCWDSVKPKECATAGNGNVRTWEMGLLVLSVCRENVGAVLC